MKARFLAAAMALTVPSVASAQGIPVYDNTSTIQLLAQVKNTLQQIQQGEQMINQAATTYNSLSKLTNIANIAPNLNNANVTQLLPSGISDIAQLAQSDISRLGSFGSGAQTLSNKFTINTNLGNGMSLDSGVATAYGKYLSTMNQGPSVAAELGYNVSNQAAQADQGLDQLRQQISSSKDPKDSMDLQARASIENARVNNRMLQLMAMQQYYAANERMATNAYRVNTATARLNYTNQRVKDNATTISGY